MHDDGLGDVLRSDSALDQALTGGQPQTVGRFRFFFDDERWEWSDEVQEIHGYAVGEIPNPTTEQVLSHKHPDDYAYVVGVLEDTRRTRTAFSTRHRMIDKQGRHHRVAVVGDLMRDAEGTVFGTEGFYIDLTPVEAEYESSDLRSREPPSLTTGLSSNRPRECLPWCTASTPTPHSRS